jgi:hypothetical protein
LGTLYRYSLIRRDPATNTLSVHRLVQAVLKDEMSVGTQRHWAERTIRAVNRAFPAGGEVETWQRCRQLISQAVVCLKLIEQWHMSFPEASRLLNQAGLYLHEHAQYTEAEPFYQRALAIREQKLGPDHPHTAKVRENYTKVLQKRRDKQEQQS